MTYQPQIVIIGAGIVGLSAAYALLEQGMHKVRVLEQAAVNHVRSTSASISRLLRFEYGADAFYSRMVQLSLKLWRDLEQKTQRTLYTPTGLLSLGREGEEVERARDIALGLGLSSEYLTEQTGRQRFPQFEFKNYNVLTYNTEGGILHASTCLQTLRRAILDLGGEIVENRRVTQIVHESSGRPIHLRLCSGEETAADRVVVSVGPWVHRLLGGLCLPITLTRQYILYFSGLTPASFGVGVFPAFVEKDLYGFPIHKGSRRWLKIASHEFGRPVDPDAAVLIEDAVIASTVYRARALLPALHRAELAHVEACIYDVSPDENFILDYLPGDQRITLATGLSGHGFKFGPLLGHLLSNLVREIQPEVPLGRFCLARFSRQQEQQAISVA